MSQTSPLKLIYTTLPDPEIAETIAISLVEQGFIACANLMPSHRSIYRWDNKIQNEQEVVLLLKTTTAGLERAKGALATIHPYDVPCILEIECSANTPYFDWVNQEVRP